MPHHRPPPALRPAIALASLALAGLLSACGTECVAYNDCPQGEYCDADGLCQLAAIGDGDGDGGTVDVPIVVVGSQSPCMDQSDCDDGEFCQWASGDPGDESPTGVNLVCGEAAGPGSYGSQVDSFDQCESNVTDAVFDGMSTQDFCTYFCGYGYEGCDCTQFNDWTFGDGQPVNVCRFG